MILSSLDFGNQTYINSFYHFFSHNFFSVKISKINKILMMSSLNGPKDKFHLLSQTYRLGWIKNFRSKKYRIIIALLFPAWDKFEKPANFAELVFIVC